MANQPRTRSRVLPAPPHNQEATPSALQLINEARSRRTAAGPTLRQLNNDSRDYPPPRNNFNTTVTRSRARISARVKAAGTSAIQNPRPRRISPRTNGGEQSEVSSPGSPTLLPCPICFTEMYPTSGCSVSCVPCGHVFCTTCIQMCCSMNSSCPICLKRISDSDITLLYL